jgi:hypothetical protein
MEFARACHMDLLTMWLCVPRPVHVRPAPRVVHLPQRSRGLERRRRVSCTPLAPPEGPQPFQNRLHLQPARRRAIAFAPVTPNGSSTTRLHIDVANTAGARQPRMACAATTCMFRTSKFTPTAPPVEIRTHNILRRFVRYSESCAIRCSRLRDLLPKMHGELLYLY